MASNEPILVVDDDDALRETLTDLLQLEGYRVVSASNGREALDLLERSPRPCAMILDMMMPVMSGWELLDVVKHDSHLSSIPVTVVSATCDFAPLADEIVKKPIRVDALLHAVARCCARNPVD